MNQSPNHSNIRLNQRIEQKYKNNKSNIDFIASCGHKNSVSYKNFKTLNQGIMCKSCVGESTRGKLVELYSGENKIGSLEQEYRCIQYFIEVMKEKFHVRKTFDGCKADIAVRPFHVDEDKWLGVQVKTTFVKTERNQYYFRLNSTKYHDCILLCMCETDKRMWIIPYEDVANVNKTIGIAMKSKYNKYEVTVENIYKILLEYYQKTNTFPFETINIPTSKSHQQEKEYREMREKCLDFIPFEYNEIEGVVYDFRIGNKKFQEKVGVNTKKNNPNIFGFNLSKNNGRENGKCVHKNYEEGDNDFYWLNCKNGNFYVIPEKNFIEKGIVGQNCKTMNFYVSPTNQNTSWCNDYLFNYNNFTENDRIKLEKLIFDC